MKVGEDILLLLQVKVLVRARFSSYHSIFCSKEVVGRRELADVVVLDT